MSAVYGDDRRLAFPDRARSGPYLRSICLSQHAAARIYPWGVVGAVADNAAGYAAYSLVDLDVSVLTVEYKLSLLAPAKGERVEARAVVMRSGRTLMIVRLDVSAYDDGMERLCATAVVTLIRMAGRSDQSRE